MSRTNGHSWGGTAYWQRDAQQQRQSRPAGRDAKTIEADIAEHKQELADMAEATANDLYEYLRNL